jgi:NADPH-dependent 2,4-dienoyl-CoA reductase/sulfur reductase-like enzyme
MSFALETDIAIIGGGPAGLSAALAAARSGALVTVLDEYPLPGGQFYKQLPDEFNVRDRSKLPKDYTKGDDLLARVRAQRIEILNETLVWGSFEPGVLCVRRRGIAGTIKCSRTIVAAGAIERAAPFPGWDLPGVMTPGGAQTLVKNQQVLPGDRILLAGSGPFLLPVATTLIAAGANIVGLYEATTPSEWAKHALRLWGHWARIAEAVRYRQTIMKAGVPIRFGRVVVRAEGAESLQRVVLMSCDRRGRTIPGTEHVEEADTLCVSYGFVPSVQVTRLLGCEHRYETGKGGWIPRHNDDLETSVPGVFVAGEVAGIGGAHVAMAEGTLAGLVAAKQLGHTVIGGDLSNARRERRHHRAFAKLVSDVFAIKPDVIETITSETLICRCEEVTAGQIRAAATPWGANLNFVKGLTRCGMGYCQGRVCGPLVEALLCRELKCAPGSVDAFRVRSPVKPVTVHELATLAVTER